MSIPKGITVKHIFNVIKSSLRPQPTYMLGRWKIKENKQHIDLNIMYSNEDHCGTCADYMLIKVPQTKSIQSVEDCQLNDEYIWIMGCTPDAHITSKDK